MSIKSRLESAAFWLVILSLFLYLLQPVITARAGLTFTVDNNGDASDKNPGDGKCQTVSNACTLRAAVEETNTGSGPNTINIPPMVIGLNSELRISDDSGDDSLSIIGAGQANTVIDGNGKTRVFNFVARSGSHSISNLTIQNAKNMNLTAPGYNGGGIFNEASLTLTNVTVATSSAFQGGGVYNQHAFQGNIPSLVLNNVTVLYNSATANVFGFGGGGLFNGSVLKGNGVTITNNFAPLQGGGIYNNSLYDAHLTDFTITGNVSRDGGGIDNDLGNMIFENGVISSNRAECCRPNGESTGGGGIYNNEGSITLTNVLFKDNVAGSPGGYGGAIYNSENATLTNVAIVNNQAVYGAGIANGNYLGIANSMSLTNVTLSGNYGIKIGGDDPEGAAIFNLPKGTLSINYSTITNNTATVIGGISSRFDNTSVAINNSILAGNIDGYGQQDCRGAITSLGYNIVGKITDVTYVQFNCTFLSLGTDKLGVNPLLLPLNAISFLYHPLQSNSPAVNAGYTPCPPMDIRGTSRPVGPNCDIGSFEYVDFNRKTYLPLIRK